MQFAKRLFSGTKNSAHKVAKLYHPSTLKEKGMIWSGTLLLVTLVVISVIWGMYISREPDTFNVVENATSRLADDVQPVTGFYTSAALARTVETLLEKPGGYLSNDVTPPHVFLDNIPNWEFGVLVQVRDLARALRNDMSRSQSQSKEDKNLASAEPKFNFDNDRWVFPATETEYNAGLKELKIYMERLNRVDAPDAQFYARADNLHDWLGIVSKRLGNLSLRLSYSVGQYRLNDALAGDPGATQATPEQKKTFEQTSWFEIDDVFYESRGTCWALLHYFKAIERDFKPILEKKNAVVSVQQIIRELEGTQQTLWSPMVLNGDGFGIITNHSLIMASYISRANSAIIDLQNLLNDG